jgi:hypothetical protein
VTEAIHTIYYSNAKLRQVTQSFFIIHCETLRPLRFKVFKLRKAQRLFFKIFINLLIYTLANVRLETISFTLSV